MSKVSAGRVMPLPKGAYDASVTYHVLDIVTYNNSSYIAKGTTTGNAPTNTTYWQLFASGSAVGSLNDIGDVSITSAVDGEVLMWDGTAGEWVNGTAASGGLLPHIIVISDTGSTVTLVKGQTTITATETTTGHFEADVTDYGTWTIHSVLSGDDATTSLNVDDVKIYTVDDTHFNASITVSYPSAATCSLSATGLAPVYATGSPFTFTVHSAATYTLTATINGTSRTKTVTIATSGQTETETFLVDGSTVTPTDDVTTWLECAYIWDKNYTTLAEVIADSETLLVLISDNNAVDYMVRSYEWCDDKTNIIPIMTSNTTPSGEAFTDGTVYVYDGVSQEPYYSFDRNSNTVANTVEPSGKMIGYGFESKTAVSCIKFVPNWAYNGVTGVAEILGSDNKTDWTVIREVNCSHVVEVNIKFGTPVSYKYYAVRCKSCTSGARSWGIGEVELYGVNICADPLAMLYIGQYNYCADALLADSTWLTEICNSEYFELVLNAKVPVMTSNTTPSGVAGCTSHAIPGDPSAVWDAYGVFDDIVDASHLWNSADNQVTNQRIWYAFTEPKTICRFDMFDDNVSQVPGTRPYRCKIQKSSDGTNWEDVVSFNNDNTKNLNSISFEPQTAQYWALFIIDNFGNSSHIWVKEMQFYGRSDVIAPSSRELKTFATASDSEIAEMVLRADRGEIDLYDDAGWRVGQEHSILLTAIPASGTNYTVGETQPAQTATIVLSNHGGVELVNSVLDKQGQTRTQCSFQFDFKELLSTGGYMNSTNTSSGSWNGCARRNWCNAALREAFPAYLRPALKLFKTITAQAYNSSSNQTTNDYLALRAEKEVLGTRSWSTANEAAALSQVTYYQTASNILKSAAGTAKSWWLRSPDTGDQSYFVRIGTNGVADHGQASATSVCISPFGCF